MSAAPSPPRRRRRPAVAARAAAARQRPRSACSAAGSSGACSCTPRRQHGYRVAVLEPDAASPAGPRPIGICVRAYTDAAALAHLQQACAAVTTEFENVPADALRQLAAALPVAPPAEPWSRSASTVRWRSAGSRRPVCPVRRTRWSRSAADAGSAAIAALLPGILKTARLGYDGKGQARGGAAPPNCPPPGPRSAACPACWSSACPCATRSASSSRAGATAQVVHLPVQQNLHRAGILAVTQVPAPDVDDPTAAQAVALAARLAAGARLRRRAVRRVLRAAGRLAGRQRDGAAAAQLGPLQHRCLRRLAVRPAGAHARRPAAGAAAPALGRR